MAQFGETPTVLSRITLILFFSADSIDLTTYYAFDSAERFRRLSNGFEAVEDLWRGEQWSEAPMMVQPYHLSKESVRKFRIDRSFFWV